MSKFKVGDKVLVTKAAISHERSWENSWVSPMNNAVGKILTIKGFTGDGEQVYFKEEFVKGYLFPLFVLEKVMIKSIKKETIPEELVIDEDRLFSFNKETQSSFLFVRNYGELAGKGFYLESFYDWRIVKDSEGSLVLIPLKKEDK